MKPLRVFAIALLLGAGGSASAGDTDAQFRLDELLSDEQYRETWRETIEDESRLPDWVLNLSGNAEPMKALDDDGDKYLVGQLCEPQQCFHQRLYVAFTWNKQRAYALIVQVPAGLPADKAPSQHATLRWLGEPGDGVKRLLHEQLRNDPNWY